MDTHSPDKRLEEVRTEKQLHQMERELFQSYRDLGKKVLEMAEMEGERTNRLVDRIIEKKRYLVMLRGGKQCDGCGLFNEADSHYCRHCGQRLGREDTLPTTTQEDAP